MIVTADEDLAHLRRCVELAREALDAGDQPFGTILVDGSGAVRFEGRNHAGRGDETRHPELEAAAWSATNLTAEARAAATVYTSGEHCPMCAAAHGWMGLGRIVYALAASRLTAWRREWGLPESPVVTMPINALVPAAVVDGPAPVLEDELRALHRRAAGSAAEGPEE